MQIFTPTILSLLSSFIAILPEELIEAKSSKLFFLTLPFEVAKIIYDENVINYKKLLNLYWQNIDPFDSAGQFCDKGLSYRSVAFYQNQNEKREVENSIKNIEKRFKGKKVVTFVREFKKFYPAEDYHQDYYQEKFMNYLLYKKACGREKALEKIWKN